MDRNLPHMGRLAALTELVSELLYPEHCLHCDVPGVWLCTDCLHSIPVFDAPRLAPLLPSGRAPLIREVFSVCGYAERAWQELIRGLKYERLEVLTPHIRTVLERYRTRITPRWPFGMGEGWMILPIPTNPEHVDARGGDHIDVWFALVQELLPEAQDGRGRLLRRTGGTAQAGFLTKGARERAAEHAFFVPRPLTSRVLLVDDVYTTGATIQAAAEACIRAGAPSVACFTGAFSGTT